MDPATIGTLSKFIGDAASGAQEQVVCSVKAAKAALFTSRAAAPALVAKLHESINVIDDVTKAKLDQITEFATNGMKVGLFKIGEGARQLGEAIPDQVAYVFTKVHEGIDAVDDDTKAKLVTAAKITGGAVLLIGGATIALPALGFCVGGVKSGSLAASAHSMIGNVTAGSMFALLQSAGALGFSTTTKAGLGVIGAAVVATATDANGNKQWQQLWQPGPSALRLWQTGVIRGFPGRWEQYFGGFQSKL